MKTNYHTHVERCGHAKGDERDMIEGAIKEGFEILGFSCHIPLPYYRINALLGLFTIRKKIHLKNTIEWIKRNGPYIRMEYKQSKDHLNVVKELKNEYKDKIVIYQGYEAEYLPMYLNYYQDLLNNHIDYLILGHHFDTYCVESRYNANQLSDSQIKRYAKHVCLAMDTNLFSYVAHPDLYMNKTLEFNDACKEAAIAICKKSIETNTPLEINGGGYRRGIQKIGKETRLTYPHSSFWEIAGAMGVTGIIGIDAHGVDEYNQKDYQALLDFANKYNIKLIDELPFKKGK